MIRIVIGAVVGFGILSAVFGRLERGSPAAAPGLRRSNRAQRTDLLYWIGRLALRQRVAMHDTAAHVRERVLHDERLQTHAGGENAGQDQKGVDALTLDRSHAPILKPGA